MYGPYRDNKTGIFCAHQTGFTWMGTYVLYVWFISVDSGPHKIVDKIFC